IKVYFVYYYQYYISHAVIGGGDSILYLIIIFFTISSLLWRNKCYDDKYYFFYNAFSVGVLLYVLLIPYGHASRISLYFLIFLIFLYPYVIERFKPKEIVRLLSCTIMIVLFIYSLSLGASNPVKDPNIPYRTILSSTV
ncbi:EpsG family protein, partial [Shewanella sp. 4t3-1-2LB]|nr:EpsG family protein [Shewanella sp. 4t3-1-2LB]